MASVSRLILTNFRCYDVARLEGIAPGAVVLTGPNGAGKTNILEAVSLLSPGRGLRGAKLEEIQKIEKRVEAPSSWAVAAQIETPHGSLSIGTGPDPARPAGKRIVRINGETAKAQNELAEHIACVWLTPQMDRLFIEAAGHRRRFLDRLVFAFDPGHSGRTTRYENAMAQRSRLLKEGHADPAWLTALEAQMAETGTAIAAARLDFAQRLQQACDRTGENGPFPRARIFLRGTVEELLQQVPALEVEDLLRYQLEQSRPQDTVTGGAASGPHRSDLCAVYAARDMPAAQCSTGEQKALLIGLILAHARLIAAERGAPPVLLLDEVAAHLDEHRRAALFDILLALGGQVWMTGTDEILFSHLQKTGQFFGVHGGQIVSEHLADSLRGAEKRESVT